MQPEHLLYYAFRSDENPAKPARNIREHRQSCLEEKVLLYPLYSSMTNFHFTGYLRCPENLLSVDIKAVTIRSAAYLLL